MNRMLLPLAMITLAITGHTNAQSPHLTALATFGTHGDGSLQPGDQGYLTTGSTERGLAYNPMTGHLLVPSRTDLTVHILDGATGADLGALDMSALTAGGNASFRINLIGVADDGGIYVGNLCNNNFPPQYNLYRWQSETDPQQLLLQAYDVSNGTSANEAGSRRYGDTMAVRGAGTNTQILIASRGTNVAILSPTDDTMTNWHSTVLHTDAPFGSLGYGVAFGPTNTFYATAGANSDGPLQRFIYNLGDGTNGTATRLQSFDRTVFPGGVSSVMVNTASNWLAGADNIPGAELVRLYNLSNAVTVPAFLDRNSFVTTNANGTFAGALAFGTNGVLYALEGNNGIMAYTITFSSAAVPPSIFYQPANQQAQPGSNATFTAAADGTLPLSYQWWLNDTNALPGATNSTLTVTNVQLTNVGNYTLVVTNVAGAATSSVATLSLISEAPGTLLVYEPFNYAADQLLTTANPNWVLNGAGDDTRVVDGSLSVAGLSLSSGNSITNGGAGAAVRIPLNTNISSGPVYYSFAMRINTLGASYTSTNTLTASLVESVGNSQEGRLIPRPIGGGQYNLGVTKVTTSGSTIGWATNNFSEGDTVFIVCRYVFNTGTTSDDAVSMWINPDRSTFGAGSPPAPTLVAAITGTDLTSANQFAFRQNTTANTPGSISYDELRVGTGWAVVTPPAPPTLNISRVGSNALLSWNTNNSTGFVPQGIPAFDDPDGWTSVTNPVTIVGTNKNVTVPVGGVKRFFRLKK